MHKEDDINLNNINILNDCFIKYVFTYPGHERILLHFINSFMEHKGYDTFISVEILNPFNIETYEKGKESIVDVKCVTNTGEIVMVEVQLQKQKNFTERIAYYWAYNYASSLKKGEGYSKLPKVISINLLDFVLYNDIKDCHTVFTIMNKETGKIFTPNCQIHIIELPKYVNNSNNSKFDNWLKLCRGYKNMSELKQVDTVFEEMENLSEIFFKYAPLVDSYRLQEAEKIFNEQDRKMAREEAIAEGKAEGLAEGEAKGRAEGRAEEKHNIAMNLLRMGYSVKVTSEITGLNIEEIEKLQNNI